MKASTYCTDELLTGDLCGTACRGWGVGACEAVGGGGALPVIPHPLSETSHTPGPGQNIDKSTGLEPILGQRKRQAFAQGQGGPKAGLRSGHRCGWSGLQEQPRAGANTGAGRMRRPMVRPGQNRDRLEFARSFRGSRSEGSVSLCNILWGVDISRGNMSVETKKFGPMGACSRMHTPRESALTEGA